MKLLLDENIDVDFRHELAGHDVNSSDIDELRRLIPGLLRALASLQPRTIVHVA